MISRWLRNDPPNDYKAMTLTELLRTWQAERNSMIGVMCAEEVCRRLSENLKR